MTHLFKYFCSTLVLIMISNILYCQISITTDISSNTTWADQGTTPDYTVDAAISVLNGYTLSIDASVTVEVNANITIENGASMAIYEDVTMLFGCTTVSSYNQGYQLIVEGQLIASDHATGYPITFTKKSGTTGWGGIIFDNADANNPSELNNCIIELTYKENNSVIADWFNYAGAIFVKDFDQLDILNCEVSNNYALYGAGLYCNTSSADFLMDNCDFLYNTAEYSGGGAYFVSNGDPDVRGCTFQYNEATNNNGGGACVIGSSPDFTYDCYFYDNHADLGSGGAMYFFESSTELDDIGLELNYADYGAGIYMSSSTVDFQTDIDITYNEADYDGGGIYMLSCSTQVVNANIEYNKADRNGGGIFAYNIPGYPYGISNCSFYDNRADYNTDDVGNGGGIYVKGGNPYISGNYIEYNRAYNGGGISLEDNTSSWIYHNFIEDNIAYNNGGGIYSYESDPEISYNGYNGGYIQDNNADNDGGGVYSLNSDIDFYGNHLINNTADYDDDNSGNGGGLYYEWDEQVEELIGINLNEFRSNSAYDGGGIYYKDVQAIEDNYKFINNLVVENIAENDGGGLYLDDLYMAPLINSNTIVDNDADDGGGLFSPNNYIAQGSCNNNLIYYNTPNSGNSIVADYDIYPGFNECCIEGKSGTGFNSFDSIPVFYNRTSDDYHLRWSPTRSPSLDQGDANQTHTGIDLDNNNRVLFGNIDMGCYEHNHVNYLIYMDDYLHSENEPEENIIETGSFNISVYPNPIVNSATFKINIITQGDCVLTITDLNGKLVWVEQFDFGNGIKTIDWNADGVEKGMYLLKACINNSFVDIIKLIKK